MNETQPVIQVDNFINPFTKKFRELKEAAKETKKTKACVICGKTLRAVNEETVQKYCSKECRNNRHKFRKSMKP